MKHVLHKFIDNLSLREIYTVGKNEILAGLEL